MPVSGSLSQLQKGPVQLPAFSLSPHLSDRQQASSVNLKPSEVRLAQPRPDAAATPGEPGSQQGLQLHDPQPALRGILKKSSSGGSEWSRTEQEPLGHQQNGGGGCEEAGTQVKSAEPQDTLVPPPRRERRQASGGEIGPLPAAPWRQRARTRRETIACTPIRVSSEQDASQEERNTWRRSQEQLVSTREADTSDTSERVQ